MFWAVAVDLRGVDFFEHLYLLDCGCLGGFTAGPGFGLDGATGGGTSRIFLGRARIKTLVRLRTTAVSSATTSDLDASERRCGGIARFISTRRCLRDLTQQGGLSPANLNFAVVATKVYAGRRAMLQVTGNVQVIESYSAEVRRSNRHTGELAVMLNLKSDFASAALGTRMIRRVADKTGNALKVSKMVEEDLRVGGRDVRNQLELFGT